jgi:2-polyprenyl-3-methyl-5-hydroxy-6-metoxy-1,4-benzoquinol methylase
MENVSQPELFEDAVAISDGGERVSHLQKDLIYYAHLSIYDFAAQFCRDTVVLDAGSGSGYGAAHLAEAGARRVTGIDLSSEAVAFSRHHFRRPNVDFQAGRIEDLVFAADSFDLVFTSNTLEHVRDVPRFLHVAHRALRRSGRLLVAVPPITDDRALYVNVINPHHVNLWSPRQWESVLNLFFEDIDVFLHGLWEVG